ncbi:MAG: hypothetical protein AB1631_15750 [Acidobacteriota bacterium]
MSQTVIAKFYVQSVERQGYPKRAKVDEAAEPHTTGVKVNLSPVYAPDDKNHENHKFWEATPSGQLWMQINNPSAFDFFKEGEEVYLTFSKPEVAEQMPTA